MRLIYMGTPDFAVPPMEMLAEAGHEILYAVTQPDAVRDRGKKIKYSPVKGKALEMGIEGPHTSWRHMFGWNTLGLLLFGPAVATHRFFRTLNRIEAELNRRP